MKTTLSLLVLSVFIAAMSCKEEEQSPAEPVKESLPEKFIVVLGVAQDAGYLSCIG